MIIRILVQNNIATVKITIKTRSETIRRTIVLNVWYSEYDRRYKLTKDSIQKLIRMNMNAGIINMISFTLKDAQKEQLDK